MEPIEDIKPGDAHQCGCATCARRLVTVRSLRKVLKHRDDDREEIGQLRLVIEALRRELAFVRALGADTLDSVTGRSFASAYDGELSTEAIRDAWTGFLAEAIGISRGGRSLHEMAEELESVQ
jgi:hypothetical protein